VRDPDSPGIEVTGGAGGTRACTEALQAIADRVERAGGHLDAAATRAERLARSVEETATWSPGTAATVCVEASPLLSPWGGLRVRATEAYETAAHLRTTAEIYACAELDATGALRVAAIVAGDAIGEQGPLAALIAMELTALGTIGAGLTLLKARLLSRTPTPAGLVLRWLGGERFRGLDGPLGFVSRSLAGPGLLPEGLGLPPSDSLEIGASGLAALIRALLPGRQPFTLDPVPQTAALLRLGGHAATLLGGTPLPGLVVAPAVTGPSRSAGTAPRSTADLLREVDELYSLPPGTVGVQSLDHADGTRSWVVAIPGMQDMGLTDGPVTTDNATNLDLIAGRPSVMSEVVMRSMLQAGVGPDEAVVLAGHSQGGMTAMQVAADPRVVAGFSVTTVVTAGSPVAGMQLPKRVQALHLEHLQDAVTALDGAPNPDRVNRTTLVRDLGAGDKADRAAALSISIPHQVTTYIRTAETADASTHPSVRRFDEALGQVLGDGTAEVNSRWFVGTRTPG
jgi:pimeloyl-ACP methyl ester carboxylesterase